MGGSGQPPAGVPTPPGPGAASAGAAGAAGAASAAAGAAAAGGLDFSTLAPATVDPRQIVRSVAQSAGWTIDESGDSWRVTVPIGSLRKQTVSIDFSRKDDAGNGLVAYASTCGPATDKNALQLLKFNTQMVHGAFAVQSTAAGDMVVVQANQLADTLDPLQVTRVMTAVAWQADKVEQTMLGTDQY